MNDIIELSIDRYKERLGKYVRGELPLRDPSITIIHCQMEYLKTIHKELIFLTIELKIRHPDWNYRILNAEKILFDILRKLRYIDKDNFALSCSRDEFKTNLEGSGKTEFINKIKEELDSLKNNNKINDHPPFLIVLNMHACYNFIQTKDIIAQLINQKGVLLLITYLEGFKREKEPSYKEANYNVNTVYITS